MPATPAVVLAVDIGLVVIAFGFIVMLTTCNGRALMLLVVVLVVTTVLPISRPNDMAAAYCECHCAV